VATSKDRFDTPTLEVAANQPFSLVFDNQDATQPHNVVIHNPDGSKVAMGDTAFFKGPEKRTYQVPALASGKYPFNCEVHPTTMTGTLTVK
jgi:plastocyanin